MKHLLLSLLFVTSISSLTAQSFPFSSFVSDVEGGCNTVSVTMSSTNLVVVAGNVVISQNCESVNLDQRIGFAFPSLSLEEYVNGSWVVYYSAFYPTSSNYTFPSLPDGKYRVVSRTPSIHTPAGCSGGVDILRSSDNQFAGFFVTSLYDETNSTERISDPLIVGETAQSDIDADIVDINGYVQSNFDDNDEVILDLSESTNFNRYFIAIQQISGSNNYQSAGWQNGTPSTVNLNDIWTQTFSNWKFWNNRNFRVQVVLENEDCPNGVWNQKFEFFNTCSGGSGTCRFTHDTDLAVFPNPATDMFVVRHLELSNDVRHDLFISDVSGRVIRKERLTGSQVDISDLDPGFYVVRIDEEGENVLSTKLVVE
jgi:hypothetical protein